MSNTGKLYIDGLDAFTEWGVFVEQYGYKALIQMPAFKSLTSTEWEEYDGEEVDLTSPQLDTKSFAMQFCIVNAYLAANLFETLSDKAYHEFEFTELQHTYKLRLVSNSSRKSVKYIGKITANFADDFPPVIDSSDLDKTSLDSHTIILNQSPLASSPKNFRQKGYELDDVDFSRLGIYVLDGTDDEIEKAPNVRSNLSVTSKSNAGVLYDEELVKYKTKDVGMKLLIQASNINDFWQRWNSLWTILLKPELRELYIDEISESYECYYKSNNVTKFDITRNGKVWCEFTTTLTFTNMRPTANYIVLATEDDEIFTTEDNYDMEININV